MRPAIKVLLGCSLLLLSGGCGFGGNDTVSEREGRAGAEQHPLLLAEFGGAYTGDEAAYLAQIGSKVAVAAGLEDACTFTLVNTDVVNAFAVPGCYIYVTRGLMSLVNSEDEIASVLAHEVGHIAGEHNEQQQRRSALRNLGVSAVAALTGSEGLTRIAGSAAAFFGLRYSRKHEYQADELGLLYLTKAGYDPHAAADMLAALNRHQAYLAGGDDGETANSIPEWALTHPYTENRIVRATAAASVTGISPDEHPEVEARFLRQLDGLLYGDDPEQGFVLGRSFAHPIMRIAFVAPEGFSLTNSPEAILINGPDGVRGQFSGGALPVGGLPAYAEGVLLRLIGDAPTRGLKRQDVLVNGIRSHILQVLVPTEQGDVIISVGAYAVGPDTAYHFVMLSSEQGQHQQAITELLGSFRTLSPAEAATLKPRVIDVVAVKPGSTLRSLAATMAADRPLDLLLALNGGDPDSRLQRGELIKVVMWR